MKKIYKRIIFFALLSETGSIVGKKDIDGLLHVIHDVIAKGKEYYMEVCVAKAQKDYNKNTQYLKYIDLYNKILKK